MIRIIWLFCFVLLNRQNYNSPDSIYIWGIISQLPQHFKSYLSIAFIFAEFVCLLDDSLPPNLQDFVTIPFQTTAGKIFTPVVHTDIFKRS